MSAERASSVFRFDKRRSNAVVTLSTGESMYGCFFTAGGNASQTGPETVGDLLNSEGGFFPFEVLQTNGARTVLCNRAHVVTVTLSENEASVDPGYEVARRRTVSMLLSNGRRVAGVLRVYRPEGRDRVSDWAKQPEQFRYLETADHSVLVNTAHIVEVSEVPES